MNNLDLKSKVFYSKQMKYLFLVLIFFLFSCTSPIVFDPSKDNILELDDPEICIKIPCIGKQSPEPEKGDLPQELQVSGVYSFIDGQSTFVFDSSDKDQYCYVKRLFGRIANLPIKFRLYDKNNKPLAEGFSKIAGVKDLKKYQKDIYTKMLYYKDAAIIKAILIDDLGQDIKVLAERKFIPIQQVTDRVWYYDCYQEKGYIFYYE